ncbi:helix-turn-helix domain-containing protein [Gallaecimonas kandeliae]|uniref:helix-turn-helix domain-containing protein n=1 Tax=Gallaecimonas kandeliae TaxID=3029055 RepID=UPI002648589E|nr:helix-turn-helix domain-containing protein [Gallaecimonas kandeliae]WKE65938.1 helix-turn-helix domain-containing protein [Gallaecimonas kandeliae]
MDKPLVAVLALPGISLFHLAIPSVVLEDLSDLYQVRHFAEQPGTLAVQSGPALLVEQGLDLCESADILIIPSWHSPYRPPSEALVATLKAAHGRGALVVGLCLGAYALAAAGLLDGRHATTHWAYADDFSNRFPQVLLDPAVLYLDHGDVMTSAGTAAAMDCCLHLLRQRHGSSVANQVARRLVMPPHRDGGQQQFLQSPVPENRGEHRLVALLDWVLANLALPHSIDSLASKAAMSRRHFTRQFQAITGLPLGAWLLERRINQAQQLLEGTALPMEQVAEQAGFGSAVTFRQQFRKAVGLAPREWRQRFRG